MRQLFFDEESIYESSKNPNFNKGHTNRQTDKPKAMGPLNLFEVGGIKNLQSFEKLAINLNELHTQGAHCLYSFIVFEAPDCYIPLSCWLEDINLRL